MAGCLERCRGHQTAFGCRSQGELQGERSESGSPLKPSIEHSGTKRALRALMQRKQARKQKPRSRRLRDFRYGGFKKKGSARSGTREQMRSRVDMLPRYAFDFVVK